MKHADRLGLVQQGEGGFVLQAHVAHAESIVARGSPHMGFRLGDHGQGLQTQKVHLQQAQVLHRILGELRGQNTVLQGKRHQFPQRSVGDDHSCRMSADVPHHALDHLARVDDLLADRVLFVLRLELGVLLDRVGQRYVQVVGHHLGHTVSLRKGNVPNSSHVPHHHLGPERTEGYDVGHALPPVLFPNVLDHLATPAHAEVNVEIWRRYTFGIKKPLEQQAEPQRIDIRYAQQVGHQASGSGTPPGSHRNILFARPLYKVRHDQEIIVETRRIDDAQLIIHPLAQFQDLGIRILTPLLLLKIGKLVALLHSLVAKALQVGRTIGKLLRNLHRHRVHRIIVLAEGQLHVAHFRHAENVRHCLGRLAKDHFHLLPRLKVELLAVIAHTLRVIQLRARLDTEQGVVRVPVLATYIVNVVGAHHLEVELLGKLQEIGNNLNLQGNPVVL